MTNKRFIESLLRLPRIYFGIYKTHIRKNTWKLRFNRFPQLPRPYRANLISKGMRSLFEKKHSRSLFGLNLGAALLIAPLFQLNQPGVVLEPKLDIPEVYITTPSVYEIPITTEPRKFITPVDNLKYMAQGYRSGHPGYDLNSNLGNNVRAMTSGRVAKIEDGQFGLGRYIILDHGQDLFTVYGHLKDFTVAPEQIVETGQIIGHVGMTGYTTGPHVHFEVHDQGKAINPKTYLGY